MKFYPYKKACALLVTGALTTGAAVPALAAETKTAAPATAEEAKAQPMTLKEIQELVVKNNRLKTTLTLNQEKVLAGLSAIDDGLKDLKDSQDKAAHARRDASTSASSGKTTIDNTLKYLESVGAAGASDQLWAGVTGALLSGAVKTASGMETLVDNVADRQRDTLEDQQTEKSAGELIADRLNELSDGIKELSGELERQVSVEELSAFMDMPVEEIEDLLKLAGEGTGDGESTEEQK